METIDIDSLEIGDIITYHGAKSCTSRLISWAEERSGQWETSDFSVPAPSHALIKTGEDEYTEADWGDSIIPGLFWVRKNTGVRQVDLITLKKRKGYHVAWRIAGELSQKQKSKLKYWLRKKAAGRVKYDYIGLLSNALATIRELRTKKPSPARANDPNKYFCSELVADTLYKVLSINNFSELLPHQISPATLVLQQNVNLLGKL